MLDTFEILTTSGVVLWSKTFTPIGASVINSFIRDVFIEERFQGKAATGSGGTVSHNRPYKHDKYTFRWTIAKDLELIFVVCENSFLTVKLTEPMITPSKPRLSTNHFSGCHG